MPNPLCNICGLIEDYDHFFTTCQFISGFKETLNNIFKSLGYRKDMITLKNIVTGYKISHHQYQTVNYLITIIAFTMYKAYYISDLKIENVNLINILKSEINVYISVSKYRHQPGPKILTQLQHLL